MKRLIIIGAGGYGHTIKDIALQTKNYEEIFFLDDNCKADEIMEKCDSFMTFHDKYTEFYPAFGNNELRIKWLDMLEAEGAKISMLVHPNAYISPTVKVDFGNVFFPNSVVNTGCEIKRGCIINCGAIIDHDCVIQEGAHICVGAIVKANNCIPRAMKVEAGQVVENGIYKMRGDK